ncbi:MAG: sigma-54 dependent transcriptional regulator [Calditrichia bacterium]
MSKKVLLLEDDLAAAEEIQRFLTRRNFTVRLAYSLQQVREELTNFSPQAAILDLKLPDGNSLEFLPELLEKYPDCRVLMMSGYGSIPQAVEAIKKGADDFLTKPVHPEQLLHALQRQWKAEQLRSRVEVYELMLADQRQMVAGPSAAMQKVLQTCRSAAQSHSTILITGETGTGKHLLAHFIHQNSPRAGAPFVYINCASLSETLLESDLFGHERGAFTGAISQKKGRVELADQGTLFLDEIGEIPPALQAKLLHFIEYGEFQRVGSTQTRRADCRLLCATNRNLAELVREKKFREDLFYRINVIQVHIPPLRERPEDIPPLLEHFLNYFCRDLGRPPLQLSDSLKKKLITYSWPGNIREMKNAVERAVVLATGTQLREADFPLSGQVTGEAPNHLFAPGPLQQALNRFKREFIQKVLESCNGNQTRAAEILQIQRSYLNRLLHEANDSGQVPD